MHNNNSIPYLCACKRTLKAVGCLPKVGHSDLYFALWTTLFNLSCEYLCTMCLLRPIFCLLKVGHYDLHFALWITLFNLSSEYLCTMCLLRPIFCLLKVGHYDLHFALWITLFNLSSECLCTMWPELTNVLIWVYLLKMDCRLPRVGHCDLWPTLYKMHKTD